MEELKKLVLTSNVNPEIEIKDIKLCNCESCKGEDIRIHFDFFAFFPRDKVHGVIKALDYLQEHWYEEGDWVITLEQKLPKTKNETEVLFEELK